ncbi:histone deacetylase [Nocardia sp. NPDC003482]
MTVTAPSASHIWYAAYGSNLHAGRLAYYIQGGTPPWTAHTYPGFRDPTPPLQTQPLTLPGTIYFAWQSKIWGGGVAFYADEPHEGWPVGAAARGYLLTRAQFADLLHQEMYRVPGEAPEPDIDEVLATGRLQLGPGRYETVLHVGDSQGYPIVTFTAPWDHATADLTRPSRSYLGMIAAGLRESHGWDHDRVVDYLARLPGVRGMCTAADLDALAELPWELP